MILFYSKLLALLTARVMVELSFAMPIIIMLRTTCTRLRQAVVIVSLVTLVNKSPIIVNCHTCD